jgi:hypothetical protein
VNIGTACEKLFKLEPRGMAKAEDAGTISGSCGYRDLNYNKFFTEENQGYLRLMNTSHNTRH